MSFETRPSFVLPFPVGGRISQTAELVNVGLSFNDDNIIDIINVTVVKGRRRT
jgi:hypothetical protein